METSAAPRPSIAKRALFGGILVIGLPLLLFALLEGGTSLLLAAHDFVTLPPNEIAESRYTRWDAELGWVSRPNVRAANLYGPGIGLATNGQGFRGTSDAPTVRVGGRKRMICSGDSFTLGYGVGDGDTWCAKLGALGRDLDAVNMGQGGYGIDQSFLWYRRDGAPLEHDLLVFAFIKEDFVRAKTNDFIGYPKPVLRAEGDSLVEHDVPVPRSGRRYLTPRRVQVLRSLRLVELATRLARRGHHVDSTSGDAPVWAMAQRVFADLERRSRTRGITLLLVYLPSREDARSGGAQWRPRLTEWARTSTIDYLDLTDSLAHVPTGSVNSLFISPTTAPAFPGATGHYTAAGNQWVAEQLRAHLAARRPDLFQ